MSTSVTITGNMTRDADLRHTQKGTAVCSFGVAVNRKFERAGEPVEETDFYEIEAWSTLAENLAKSVGRGTRVVITGRLRHHVWEQDGVKKDRVVIVAEEVAPSMRWAEVAITKNSPGTRVSAPHPASVGTNAAPGGDMEPF